MNAWILLLLLTVLPGVAAAQDAPAQFDQANREYERGEFAAAIAGYRKLIAEDRVSAALYFNLGNALFRDGQVGQAILCYRLAQRLAPRDPDIRANLRFARETVAGAGPRPVRRWERWLNLLALNEAAWIAAGTLWIWLLLLALIQVRRDWARVLRPYAAGVGIAVVAAGLWLGLLAKMRLGTSAAVVIADEAAVRYGPFQEAQSSHTLRDGAELAVLDRKDGWLQVTDGAKRTGWLQTNDVALVPRG